MKQIALVPQNIFLVFCLLTGLVLCFINPPFQTPDEAQHFFKIYAITQKTLFFKIKNNQTGSVLPLSVIKISEFEKFPIVLIIILLFLIPFTFSAIVDKFYV